MDKQSIHFCSQCNNISNIYLNEQEELIYSCKICSNSEEFKGDNCIYTYNFEEFDSSIVINQNKYITHDKTIPTIDANVNLKCPNKECTDGKKFKFINYDTENMKYIYICENCGQKWNNQNIEM